MAGQESLVESAKHRPSVPSFHPGPGWTFVSASSGCSLYFRSAEARVLLDLIRDPLADDPVSYEYFCRAAKRIEEAQKRVGSAAFRYECEVEDASASIPEPPTRVYSEGEQMLYDVYRDDEKDRAREQAREVIALLEAKDVESAMITLASLDDRFGFLSSGFYDAVDRAAEAHGELEEATREVENLNNAFRKPRKEPPTRVEPRDVPYRRVRRAPRPRSVRCTTSPPVQSGAGPPGEVPRGEDAPSESGADEDDLGAAAAPEASR